LRERVVRIEYSIFLVISSILSSSYEADLPASDGRVPEFNLGACEIYMECGLLPVAAGE
jgi:hypothetical protein